jgi:hypothetical protein
MIAMYIVEEYSNAEERNMKTSLILLKSMTEASKAKYLLDRMRIFSTMEKSTFKRGGCAFGVRVAADPAKICALLKENGILCQEVR